MFTMNAASTRKSFSAVAAIAIVGFSGLVMDQGHLAGAPRGTIEVGEPTALDAGVVLARLPEVVVVAKRESATYFAAAQLPEIVVVAKRVAHMVAKDDGDSKRRAAPAISAGF